MNAIPRNDKVIVERIEGPKVTQGGIHLPDNRKEEGKSMQGRIIAIGPGKPEDDAECGRMDGLVIGQVVLFGKYTGWDTELAGKKLVILKEEDVLAVVEE